MDIVSIKRQLHTAFDTEFLNLQRLCCYTHVYQDKSQILDDLSYPEITDIQMCYGIVTNSLSKEEYTKMVESGLISSHLIFKFKTKNSEYVKKVGIDKMLRIVLMYGKFLGFTDDNDMSLDGIYITRNSEDYDDGIFVDKHLNEIPSIVGRIISVKQDPLDIFLTWYVKKTEG